MKIENLLGIAKVLLGRYGGHKWQKFGSKGFGNMRSMPSQNRVLASKAGQQARELKETSKHTSNKDKLQSSLKTQKILNKEY